MKWIVLILLFTSCNKLIVSNEVHTLPDRIHLYIANLKDHHSQVFIDDGSSSCYKALTDKGKPLLVCSPVDLINYMERFDYKFKESITYVTGQDNWFTVWVFEK